jgi:hypothetical protein
MTTCSLLVLGALHLHPTILLYADPGSGILIWQLATAGVLGLLFFAKTTLRKIRAMLGSRLPEKGDEPPASNT